MGIKIQQRGRFQSPVNHQLHKFLRLFRRIEGEGVRLTDVAFRQHVQRRPGDNSNLAFAAKQGLKIRIFRG